MIEAIGIVSLAEPVLTDIVAGTLTSAGLRIGHRARKGLDRVRGVPDRLSNVELIGLLSGVTTAEEVTLTSLVALPESGLSAAQLRKTLESSSTQTVVQQLVCAALLNSPDEVFERIEYAFTLAMKDAAHEFFEVSHDLEPAAREFFGLLRLNAERLVSPGIQDESREPLAELYAQLTLVTATVDRIDALVQVLLERQNPEFSTAVTKWREIYRKQCAKRHGVITPPDFKERNPVSLDKIYVPARVSISDHKGTVHESVSLYEIIEHLDRDVLVGDPGGGKSTTTHAIAYRLAETADAVLPFVVVLRDYAPHSDDMSVVQYIEKQLRTVYQAEAPAGTIDSLLAAGDALIIFDGLDELIDSSRRVAIAERIELFSNRYPGSRIYVTSRKVGYKEARLDPSVFRLLELEGYTSDEVQQYVSKWFAIQPYPEGVDTKALQLAFMHESEAIPDLRSNPLLLALLCIIYRGQGYLPKHRVGIYEECSKLLFETWDKSRGIVFDFSFERYISDALKHLAFWMLGAQDSEEGVTEDRLVRELTDFFQGRTYETTDAAQRAAAEFVSFCSGRAWVLSEAGMTPEGDSLFKFTHRTFMEYFAAIQITRLHPEPRKLARFLLPRIAKNEWDTVGQLAIHLIHRSADQGGETAITQLLESSTSRSIVYRENVLDFVGRCLVDLHVSPSLVKQAVRNSVELLLRFHSTSQRNQTLSNMQITSWRRLLYLERADAVKEEFDTMVEEFLRPESSEFQKEVAALVIMGIPGSSWSRKTGKLATPASLWEAFSREKLLRHFDVLLALTEYDRSVAHYMQAVGILSFENLRRMISEDNDLPLDFAFRSYPLLIEASRVNVRAQGMPLNLTVLALTGSRPYTSEQAQTSFGELVSNLAAIIRTAHAPLVRQEVFEHYDSIRFSHLVNDLSSEAALARPEAWGVAVILLAVHLEDDLVRGLYMRKERFRGHHDSFAMRLLNSRTAGASELLEAEAEAVSSSGLGEYINAWIEGRVNFLAVEDSPA